MTNDELEKKIAKAFSDMSPDILDRIMDDIEKTNKKDSYNLSDLNNPDNVIKLWHINSSPSEVKCDNNDADVIASKAHVQKKKSRLAKGIAIAVAAAAAVTVCITGIGLYSATTAVASTVSIDVNPSIEINVNKNKKVLDVIPKSTEAEDVIGDMNFKGADLEVAINALLGSMISRGYLSEMANSILVSVDNADPEIAAELQNLLMDEINDMIGSNTFNGAIIGQTISEDDELIKSAGEYGITLSKAQLIKQITTQNPTLKFDELVQLTINELNLLKKGDTETIKSIGQASDIAYIGADKAVQIALEDSGFIKEDTHFLKVEMDYENGSLCYEVSFHKYEMDYGSDFDYDYDIDAVTGEITGVEKEIENLHVLKDQYSEGELMGEESAKEIAFNLAGVDGQNVYEYEFETNMKHVPHYDIEFKSDGYEFDYSINAYDGTVYKNKWERDDELSYYDANMANPTDAEKEGFIGEDRARQIAYQHAGVSDITVYDLEIELEREKGNLIYEVEFKSGIYDYSYDIDPISGQITDYEMEYDD